MEKSNRFWALANAMSESGEDMENVLQEMLAAVVHAVTEEKNRNYLPNAKSLILAEIKRLAGL